MNKFLKRKHILVYVFYPKEELGCRNVFEPLSADVGETKLDDAIWSVEKFTRMWIEDGKFKYVLYFERFFDEYSVFSENIPIGEEKESFRENFLKKNKSFARRAKKVKLAKLNIGPDDAEAHVLSKEEEEDALKAADAEKTTVKSFRFIYLFFFEIKIFFSLSFLSFIFLKIFLFISFVCFRFFYF